MDEMKKARTRIVLKKVVIPSKSRSAALVEESPVNKEIPPRRFALVGMTPRIALKLLKKQTKQREYASWLTARLYP
ncbi:MAG: hypothetical protein LW855_00710 [Alphaproteobacteria bacterium]|jgi:hypothetical protein|nr:hypothetical protein [Alphaproteobacteria bacterium]